MYLLMLIFLFECQICTVHHVLCVCKELRSLNVESTYQRGSRAICVICATFYAIALWY